MLCALTLVGCVPTKDNIMELQTFTTSRDFVSKIDDRKIDKVREYDGFINTELPEDVSEINFDDYFIWN